jgi:hypothetical protein
MSRIINPGAPYGHPIHSCATFDRIHALLQRRLTIYGLWDPDDSRLAVPFQAVLSAEACWKDDVRAMIAGATLVILDLEHPTEGIIAELEIIRECTAEDRTLLIYSESEREWWRTNHQDFFGAVRWKVCVTHRGRGTVAHTDKFDLPESLQSYLRQLVSGVQPRNPNG